MVGYGDNGAEDNSFVLELTYNYGINKYELGDDFIGLHIQSPCSLVTLDGEVNSSGEKVVVSPDGYKFYIQTTSSATNATVQGITLASTNLDNTVKFWEGVLDLKVRSRSSDEVLFASDSSQAFVRFVLRPTVNHAKAYGRVAFAVPDADLVTSEKAAREGGYAILTPLVTLKTEGKADVSVVIFSDPDGYEICFVGDAGFRDLSKFDPEGDGLLDKAMLEDKSDEWFAKKGKSKESA